MLISLYLIVIFDTEVLKVSGILMPLEQFDTSSELGDHSVITFNPFLHFWAIPFHFIQIIT